VDRHVVKTAARVGFFSGIGTKNAAFAALL